jgi:hypothetical protein
MAATAAARAIENKIQSRLGRTPDEPAYRHVRAALERANVRPGLNTVTVTLDGGPVLHDVERAAARIIPSVIVAAGFRCQQTDAVSYTAY